MKRWLLTLIIMLPILLIAVLFILYVPHSESAPKIGSALDSLNHVKVYYNGSTRNVSGRNTAPDGYNLGLKYQCVEFVKRYYYEHLNHKMPNTYGHAKNFFRRGLADGALNKERDLYQFANPSGRCPKVNDILVFDGWAFNKFGHVAIISAVHEKYMELVQQNAGPLDGTREQIGLSFDGAKWKIEHGRVLGVLARGEQ